MSQEALAIIFAPTCVQIDAVTQLMRYSTISVSSTATNASTISLPEVQPTLKKARQMFWSAIRKKPTFATRSRNPTPLYQPQNLMDLELIKESGRWTRLFEFMIRHANELTLGAFTIVSTFSFCRKRRGEKRKRTKDVTLGISKQPYMHVFTCIAKPISVFGGDESGKKGKAGRDRQGISGHGCTRDFPESIEIAAKFDALHLDLKNNI